MVDLRRGCFQVTLIHDDESLVGGYNKLVLVKRVPAENWRQLLVAIEILGR